MVAQLVAEHSKTAWEEKSQILIKITTSRSSLITVTLKIYKWGSSQKTWEYRLITTSGHSGDNWFHHSMDQTTGRVFTRWNVNLGSIDKIIDLVLMYKNSARIVTDLLGGRRHSVERIWRNNALLARSWKNLLIWEEKERSSTISHGIQSPRAIQQSRSES